MVDDTISPETSSYARERSSVLAQAIPPLSSSGFWVPLERRTGRSLSAHMRRLRRQRQGISHWLALAVLAGSVVAFAFVNFFAH
jgi:hypothetical protein